MSGKNQYGAALEAFPKFIRRDRGVEEKYENFYRCTLPPPFDSERTNKRVFTNIRESRPQPEKLLYKRVARA